MMYEAYRLTLSHYMVDKNDGTRTELELPIVIEQMFDRTFGGSPIILSRMLDEMKRVVLLKKGEEVTE